MVDRSKAWFAPKRYGYGSSLPIRWQGWVAMLAMIAAVTLSAMALSGVMRIAVILLLILGFSILCARTTEGGWRWRSGEPD